MLKHLPFARTLVLSLADVIEANKARLSEIDGAIGDGDHGVNMAKGFALVKTRLADSSPSLPDALHLVGQTLLSDIGGSMGPIYGTFFLSMSEAARAALDRGVPPESPQTLSSMLASALAAITDLGGAKVGDKTLVDTLAPAEAALREALAAGVPERDAIERMTQAARLGCESTRDLVARLGRASRLGERSRGTLDAGASSCALILETLACHYAAATAC